MKILVTLGHDGASPSLTRRDSRFPAVRFKTTATLIIWLPDGPEIREFSLILLVVTARPVRHAFLTSKISEHDNQ